MPTFPGQLFLLSFCFKKPQSLTFVFLFLCKDTRKLECPILSNALSTWQKGFCSVLFHGQAFSYDYSAVLSFLTLCRITPLSLTPCDDLGLNDFRGMCGLDTSLTLVLLPCCRICCSDNPALLPGLFTYDLYVIIYFIDPHYGLQTSVPIQRHSSVGGASICSTRTV